MARRLPDKRIKKLFVTDTFLNPLRAQGVPPSPVNGKVASGQYYSLALREKQKMRAFYGNMKDHQFKKYVDDARRSKGNPVDSLLRSLERRLETVLYRTGFPVTMRQAQQWISHQHVWVNGRVVDKKGANVYIGDIVQIKPEFLDVAAKQARVAAEMRSEAGCGGAGSGDAMGYLEVNRKAMCAMVVREPTSAELLALARSPMLPLVKDANLQPRFAMIYYR